jgi:uncharacterized protein YpiB (UPF0302 family)
MVSKDGKNAQAVQCPAKRLCEDGREKRVEFLMDMVTQLEAEKKSGSYIANNVKPIKNWLSFNGININQRIEIARRNELVTVSDERVPTQKELASIFLSKDCLEQKPRQHS